MQFDATTINMLVKGIWETIYMVFLSSALSYVIGIPLGIALVVTDREGISQMCIRDSHGTRLRSLSAHNEPLH